MPYPIVTVENVDFAYGSGEYAVKDINISIEKGTVVGLVGPIGSGKTTILRLLASSLQPSHGSITKGIKREDCVYLPASQGLVEQITVRQNLKIWRSAYCMEKEQFENIVEMFDLNPIMKKRVSRLSSGTRQKVAIAAVLISNAELLLLDEPFVNLDYDTSMKFCNYIERNIHGEKAAFISSHNLDYVERLCNKVIFLSKGKIVDTVANSSNVPGALAAHYQKVMERSDFG